MAKHTLVLVLLYSLIGLVVGHHSPHCKAFPGDDDWPSQQAWHGLNVTVSGRLLAPSPPGAVCHRDRATYDAEQCPRVQKAWTTFEFHARDPVSVLWNQWTGFDCLPDPSRTCTGRGYPAYVVDALGTEDVKKAVDFARKHNVRLVVKNTGYDFLGRSTAPAALSIRTINMKTIRLHEKGCFKLSSGRVFGETAVTVGAGTLTIDIYRALDEHGQTFIGAMGPTVGIAGYLSGGGHSNLSGRYGLGADTVIEMEVVTPGGEVLTVNEHRHSHLFWALRGGGGSTFGVVTKITMRTFPTPKVLGVQWVAGIDASEAQASNLAPALMSKLPEAIDAGLLGWNAVADKMHNPVPAPEALKGNISGLWGVNAVLDTASPSEAHRILKPLSDTLQRPEWKGKARLWLKTRPFPSYLAYVTGVYTPRPGGYGWWEVSRMLDREALSGDAEALANALRAVRSDRGNMFAMTLAGKGVQDVRPAGGDNSVNPAWRSAYALGMTSLTFKDERVSEGIRDFLNTAWQPMRDLTPESGSYIDEGMPYEKDWQHTFWGSNYQRLLDIKRRLDPEDVLWCSPCVGNERWRQGRDGRLCRIR